jgi:hypothetical protein
LPCPDNERSTPLHIYVCVRNTLDVEGQAKQAQLLAAGCGTAIFSSSHFICCLMVATPPVHVSVHVLQGKPSRSLQAVWKPTQLN